MSAARGHRAAADSAQFGAVRAVVIDSKRGLENASKARKFLIEDIHLAVRLFQCWGDDFFDHS